MKNTEFDLPFLPAKHVRPGDYKVTLLAVNNGKKWVINDSSIESCRKDISYPAYKLPEINSKYFSVTVGVIVSLFIVLSWFIGQEPRRKKR